jgi:hypothetical protein
MAKNERSSVSSNSGKSGKYVPKDPAKSGTPAKTVAGSALSQRPNKTSSGSERVIKGVSLEHRDALKRLVDR